MNILFFTKGGRAVGSSRLRVWLIAEKLKERYGWNHTVIHSVQHSLFSFSKQRVYNLRKIFSEIRDTKHEILFVHKSLFPWDVVLLILAGRFLGRKRLVYDLDDAQWHHSFVKTWLFIKSAHAVLCGSHSLMEWVQKHTRRALFLPTAVDADLYRSFSVMHEERAVLTIGWVGVGRGHFLDGHFAMIKPALEELAKKKFPFRFVIIGSQNYQPLKDYFKKSAYEVLFIDELNWADPASVPRAVQQYQFDIGIMPVSDTPFNRRKCAFKAIEYMACGVPAVASRVGEATLLIAEGKNGYLANTTEEWVRALGALLENTELRREMGKKAQQTIAGSYSHQKIIPEIMHALNSL